VDCDAVPWFGPRLQMEYGAFSRRQQISSGKGRRRGAKRPVAPCMRLSYHSFMLSELEILKDVCSRLDKARIEYMLASLPAGLSAEDLRRKLCERLYPELAAEAYGIR